MSDYYSYGQAVDDDGGDDFDAQVDALLADDYEVFDVEQAASSADHFRITKLDGRKLTPDESRGLMTQLEAQWERGEDLNAEQAYTDHWKYVGRPPFDLDKSGDRSQYMADLARGLEGDDSQSVFGRDWSDAEPPDLESRDGWTKYMVERAQGRPEYKPDDTPTESEDER